MDEDEIISRGGQREPRVVWVNGSGKDFRLLHLVAVLSFCEIVFAPCLYVNFLLCWRLLQVHSCNE